MKKCWLNVALMSTIFITQLGFAQESTVTMNDSSISTTSNQVNPTPKPSTTAIDTTLNLPSSVSAPALEKTVPALSVSQVKDHGDPSWLLSSTALVLMMTIPGLALFYAGMVRRKNVLSTMMYSFATTSIVSIAWVIIGYSLAFSENSNTSFAPFIGGLNRFLLKGMTLDQVWTPTGGLATNIPETLFMVYQMTFAIITAAIISGAFAERMKFSAFMVFTALWTILVYSPICHWVWDGKGWLATAGALDFAGGTVVHINAGIAGLVAAYLVGRRLGFGREVMAPHNLTLTLCGASLLWVGWFGFNAGSELAADNRSAMAMVVTQIAAAAASLTWMAVEYAKRGRTSALGAASGAVAGLVGITPASGFVDVSGALVIGLTAGVACFWGATGLKRLLKVDDSLDVFGIHGIGGIVGALLTAVFVTKSITGIEPKPILDQLFIQLEGVIATLIYSGITTYLILKLIDTFIGLRVTPDEEQEGLDISEHREHI